MRTSTRLYTCLVLGAPCCWIALPTVPAVAQTDVAALVARIPERDRDFKHTGPTPEAAREIYDGILAGGKASVAALVDMLVNADRAEEDFKARYVLHGLALDITTRKDAAQRRMLGEVLTEALGKGKPANVKQYLVQEVQFLRDPNAVPALGKLLADGAVCDFAARALCDIGGEAAAAQLADALPDATGRGRLSVIQALGRLRAANSVSPLLSALSDNDRVVRAAAAAALAKTGSVKAAEPLSALLAKASGYERTEVTDACLVLAGNLVAAGHARDAATLCRQVWSAQADRPEPQTQNAVIELLAADLPTKPVPALVAQLKADHPAERAAALRVLQTKGDSSAFDAVAVLLNDDDAGVRLAAIPAAAAVGKERSIPVLTGALPGESPAVQRALQAALLTVEEDKANAALATALAAAGDGAKGDATRLVLLGVLADRRANEAAEPAMALAAADGTAKPVRLKALRALAVLADGRFAPRLVRLLSGATDSDLPRAVEDALVAACERLPGKQRVEPLLPALETGEVGARCALLRVVGRLGTDEAVEVLVESLADTETAVAEAAMKALSNFPNTKAAPALLEVAKAATDDDQRFLALRGYAKLSEQERDGNKRLALLKDGMSAARRPNDKQVLVRTMGSVRSLESLTQVLTYLDDADLTEDVGRTVVNIANRIKGQNRKETKEALELVLQKAKSEDVRKPARDLLSKLK